MKIRSFLALIGLSVAAAGCTHSYTQELPDGSTIETRTVGQAGLFTPPITNAVSMHCPAGQSCVYLQGNTPGAAPLANVALAAAGGVAAAAVQRPTRITVAGSSATNTATAEGGDATARARGGSSIAFSSSRAAAGAAVINVKKKGGGPSGPPTPSPRPPTGPPGNSN